jgi:predicted enzyme related to lactoylglutathione lyase
MDASAFLPEGVPSHWAVYFGTANTDASVAQAVQLGATVVQAAEDTPYGRLASLTDPTGAMFKLHQPNG